MVIKLRDLTPEEIAARGRALADARDREKVEATKKPRAPAGTFDRTAYQREFMRKKRAAAKKDKP